MRDKAIFSMSRPLNSHPFVSQYSKFGHLPLVGTNTHSHVRHHTTVCCPCPDRVHSSADAKQALNATHSRCMSFGGCLPPLMRAFILVPGHQGRDLVWFGLVWLLCTVLAERPSSPEKGEVVWAYTAHGGLGPWAS